MNDESSRNRILKRGLLVLGGFALAGAAVAGGITASHMIKQGRQEKVEIAEVSTVSELSEEEESEEYSSITEPIIANPDNPEADVDENQTAIVLSEFDQLRTALLEESGIDLPENPDAVVTEFFHETFDEGDTVVGGRFAVGDDYVGRMQSAITAVMGDPVQEEENDGFQFTVWSQPTDKENVVNECVLDVTPEGETSIKYHKDLDMNY